MDHIRPQALLSLPTCPHRNLVNPQTDHIHWNPLSARCLLTHIPLLSGSLHVRVHTSHFNLFCCLFSSLTSTGTHATHVWSPTALSVRLPYILGAPRTNYITEQMDILISSESPTAIGFSTLLPDLTVFLQVLFPLTISVFSCFYYTLRPSQLPFSHWTAVWNHLHCL